MVNARWLLRKNEKNIEAVIKKMSQQKIIHRGAKFFKNLFGMAPCLMLQ
jgi:hypothetical protein